MPTPLRPAAVRRTWYTKKQTELGTRQYPVYELLRPHGAAHYKLKTAAPG